MAHRLQILFIWSNLLLSVPGVCGSSAARFSFYNLGFGNALIVRNIRYLLAGLPARGKETISLLCNCVKSLVSFLELVSVL